jgi:eukaryotic-like serine/threonine-protein kinase
MTSGNLPPIEEAPAAHLEGRVLDNGWSVGSRMTKSPGATGGHFSVSYVAHHEDGRQAFMKALNFHVGATSSAPLIDRLNDFTSAYIFERDLLADCCDRKMSRVIKMIDHGQVSVPAAGPILSEVPYLILELADGDIRAFQASMSGFDCAWVFRVMKHALQGVGQLHYAHTAHQDLKPSNVLTQEGGMEMKLGDLGRADRRGIEGPWSELSIPGAIPYAPPEQQYDSFGRSWEDRKAADLYLVGSLGVQLFLGHAMSVLIQVSLPAECQLRGWSGSFEEVVPYLRTAHSDVILALRRDVLARTGEEKSAEAYASAIGQMTDPDPSGRGHPKDRAARTSSFSVQRYVSLMNLLSTRAHYRTLGDRSSG